MEMTKKEAIQILMLCPIYFRYKLKDRLVLVKEYIHNFYEDNGKEQPF